MFKRLLLGLFLVLPTSSVSASPVFISGDPGGNVDRYITRWASYSKTNTPVVIKGFCASACARFMTLPKVCTTSGGYFLLHGLRDAEDRVLYDRGVEDSRRWESPKALALQIKYKVFGFGVEPTRPAPSVQLEPGVSIVYIPMDGPNGREVYQKFLRVDASLLVRKCEKAITPPVYASR